MRRVTSLPRSLTDQLEVRKKRKWIGESEKRKRTREIALDCFIWRDLFLRWCHYKFGGPFDQPKCQNCHFDSERKSGGIYSSAILLEHTYTYTSSHHTSHVHTLNVYFSLFADNCCSRSIQSDQWGVGKENSRYLHTHVVHHSFSYSFADKEGNLRTPAYIVGTVRYHTHAMRDTLSYIFVAEISGWIQRRDCAWLCVLRQFLSTHEKKAIRYLPYFSLSISLLSLSLCSSDSMTSVLMWLTTQWCWRLPSMAL